MSSNHSNNDSHHGKDAPHEHHILSNALALKIWGILIGLTAITVIVAQIDLGPLNFAVAMLVASIKASLVCIFFMGLKWDHKENAVIFTTSIIFLSIFMNRRRSTLEKKKNCVKQKHNNGIHLMTIYNHEIFTINIITGLEYCFSAGNRI